MKVCKDIYKVITSTENLFEAWSMFKHDKQNRFDVEMFEKNVEQEIFMMARELRDKTYKHGPYSGFWIYDPKRRHIHKATVRDRIVHHAIFNVLDPIFEPTFIPSSFSCRIGKGTHKGVAYVARALCAASKNNTVPCFVLKCDVRKFFDSIDHGILLGILQKKIVDPDALWLLEDVIESYTTGFVERERERERVKYRRSERASQSAISRASFSQMCT